jgi:hypothetical protein
MHLLSFNHTKYLPMFEVLYEGGGDNENVVIKENVDDRVAL